MPVAITIQKVIFTVIADAERTQSEKETEEFA